MFEQLVLLEDFMYLLLQVGRFLVKFTATFDGEIIDDVLAHLVDVCIAERCGRGACICSVHKREMLRQGDIIKMLRFY